MLVIRENVDISTTQRYTYTYHNLRYTYPDLSYYNMYRYPKATLLNPDWCAQADLEKRLEAAILILILVLMMICVL